MADGGRCRNFAERHSHLQPTAHSLQPFAVTTLFISDLHLDGSHAEITDQFIEFIEREAKHAEALYILGDLFEAWIGDDDPDPDKQRSLRALRSLTASGVRTYLIHGNRDFLIGKRFCAETGVHLLKDGTIVQVYGKRVLLMHGDSLCIDDPSYQRLRRIVRNPIVQFIMRSMSLKRRQDLAARMRAGSKAHIESMDRTAPQIMDVNQGEVLATFTRFHVDCMIHGHTHRPAIHSVQHNDKTFTRIVLGDWYEQGSVLRWDEKGYELSALARAASDAM
jgi:UDP-2,3-diacylglucosamine hydrolase